MVLSTAALIVLAALTTWLVGGAVLRIAGFLLAATGLIGLAISGHPVLLVLVVPGAALWMVGHWLYARRAVDPSP